MRITCLGSGSILTDRLSSSFVVDESVLVDIPNGSMKSMRRLGLDPSRLDLVLVSHLHADHFFDSVFLLIENGLRSKRTQPLLIVGPAGTEERLSRLFDLAYPESKERVWRNCSPMFIVAQDRVRLDFPPFDITPFRVQHSGMEAFGYLLGREGVNGRVAFSGDTEPCDGVTELVAKSDLAFVDCAFLDARSGHMGVSDVGKLSAKGNSRVVGTHLSDDVRAVSADLDFTVCDDGEVYVL